MYKAIYRSPITPFKTIVGAHLVVDLKEPWKAQSQDLLFQRKSWNKSGMDEPQENFLKYVFWLRSICSRWLEITTNSPKIAI